MAFATQYVANLRQAIGEARRDGPIRVLYRRLQLERRHLCAALVVDALALALAWLAWGQHGKPFGVGLDAIGVVLLIFGGMISGSGVEFSGRPYGGGGGIAGRNVREHMTSNKEWTRAQRDHRRRMAPTAKVVFLAGTFPFVVGVLLWLVGL